MKKMLLLPALLLLGFGVFAQTGFQKVIGGSQNDRVFSTIETSDGGYMISGLTNSYGAGGYDIFLIKFDSNGNTSWSKTYGGTSNEEVWSAVYQLSDGNYILYGSTTSFGANARDGYIMKIDPTGNVLWSQRYSLSSNENIRSIVELSNGDIILGGNTNVVIANTDMLLIRLTSSGSVVYSKVFGVTGNDHILDLKLLTDGTLLVSGILEGSGLHNYALLNMDTNGNVIWQKSYGGSNDDEIWDTEQTADGGYICVGNSSTSSNGGFDGSILKFSATGNLTWARSFGGSGNEYLREVEVLPSGDYLIYGTTASYGNSSGDLIMMRVDQSGNLVWAKTSGGTSTEYLEQGDFTFNLTSDNKIILGATSSSFGSGEQGLFIKTDTTGNMFCNDISSLITFSTPSISTNNPSVSMVSTGTFSSPATIVNTPNISIVDNCQCNPGFGGAEIEADSLSCTEFDFSSTFKGDAIEWLWDFGDGQTSTDSNPTHNYISSGTYTVCLTITNSCGYDTTICESVTLNAGCECGSGSFNGLEITSDAVDCNGVSLGNTYTGVITDYWWDFGDGQYSDLADPIHHYDTLGTYWVCLTITNGCGEDTTICDSITISQICEPYTDLSITYVTNGFSVDFSNSYAGEATDWWWDFGDGQFSNQEKPTHTFPLEGTYWVCMTITNECDEDTTVCDSVTIMISPKGINSFAESIGLNYYPNPANDVLNIVTKENVELAIYSMTGALVRMESLRNGKQTLDLSNLSRGVYTLHFRNEKGDYQDKLIITR